MFLYKNVVTYYWIFRKTNNNFIIAIDGNFTLIDVVVFKLVLYPKKLSTIT